VFAVHVVLYVPSVLDALQYEEVVWPTAVVCVHVQVAFSNVVALNNFQVVQRCCTCDCRLYQCLGCVDHVDNV
jgi:hypothetical protein